MVPADARDLLGLLETLLETTHNPLVVGSSPTRPTTASPKMPPHEVAIFSAWRARRRRWGRTEPWRTWGPVVPGSWSRHAPGGRIRAGRRRRPPSSNARHHVATSPTFRAERPEDRAAVRAVNLSAFDTTVRVDNGSATATLNTHAATAASTSQPTAAPPFPVRQTGVTR